MKWKTGYIMYSSLMSEANMNMYGVNDDVRRKVYETFGRNEEIVRDDVNIIKKWMRSQPHLPEIMEDAKIRNFLNLNKFSIEKTKERIDMYYTIKSVIPDLFDVKSVTCDNINSLLEKTYVFTFPKPINEVHRVYFLKQKKLNAFNVLEVTNRLLTIFEVRLYEDFMVDDIIIIDFSNLTLGDIKEITPTLMSNFFAIYKKVYALRVKRLIYVNCPLYITLFITVLKSVMTPKVFERVEVHEDAEILKDLFPRDELPKEYGGEGPSLDQMNDMMREKLLEYQSRLERLYKLRVDESSRPEKLNNDEILGFYGNFKKMNVD